METKSNETLAQIKTGKAERCKKLAKSFHNVTTGLGQNNDNRTLLGQTVVLQKLVAV